MISINKCSTATSSKIHKNQPGRFALGIHKYQDAKQGMKSITHYQQSSLSTSQFGLTKPAVRFVNMG
jgi:hypothetical protein